MVHTGVSITVPDLKGKCHGGNATHVECNLVTDECECSNASACSCSNMNGDCCYKSTTQLISKNVTGMQLCTSIMTQAK